MKLYYYLFYKLYKFTEDWGFWPEVRAFCLVIMLNVALLSSLLNYYTILTGRFINLPDSKIGLYFLISIIVIINYLLLLKGDKKEKILELFDKMPQKKKDLGSIIIFLSILLLIIAFISSLFMLNSVR